MCLGNHVCVVLCYIVDESGELLLPTTKYFINYYSQCCSRTCELSNFINKDNSLVPRLVKTLSIPFSTVAETEWQQKHEQQQQPSSALSGES